MSLRPWIVAPIVVVAVVGPLGSGQVSAAPRVVPGLNFGSSVADPPKTTANVTVWVDNVDLSRAPDGTTYESTAVRSVCAYDVHPNEFTWDGGDGGPYNRCNRDTSSAVYRYVITMPDGRAVTRDVSFTETSEGASAVGVISRCIGVTAGCSGERIRETVTPDGVILEPVVRFGPFPG